MLQEKNSNDAFSNIYKGVQNCFFLNFKLFHQTMINRTKVKNILKTISTRFKFLNIIKLGAISAFFLKISSSMVESNENFNFLKIFCYFNSLAFMLSKNCVDNACI